ncbi:Cloroperoxidase [Coprinellus micaceus]|uniref:Cloroperoxidase n=1 Tax=Coprinellus micaceus TaxID=71717 RepID=A0A4Y7TF20_COPMI|nr:Cloroperoxidase [Coprinellus micaceus]
MPPEGIQRAIFMTKVMAWDAGCTLLNLVSPSRRAGSVTPQGHPGAQGIWPEFIPPTDSDSRCSCPALNAMANHGILPRDGKNITFGELGARIRTTYNFAPSFCYFVPSYAANMLGKDYAKDTFDLKELDLHNGIEHDASLTRQDVALEPDQSKPYTPFIKELLAEATGEGANGVPLLTIADMSRYSAKRRVEAKETNPDFTLEKIHKTFGSTNASTLLTAFGGRIDDLTPFLLEERLPEGWESSVRAPYGLTIITFNLGTILKVERGIDEETFIAQREAQNKSGGVQDGESGGSHARGSGNSLQAEETSGLLRHRG